MAIIGTSTLLRALSIFHLTLAYYLLTSPETLKQQNLVIVLGAAMDIPLPSAALSYPSSATALAACFLLFIAVSDLTAPSMQDEIGSAYWSIQVPVRVAFLFALTGGIYVGKFGLEESKSKISSPSLEASGMREALCNSFVFSWAFVELLLWFWTYTVVREERRDFLAKQEQKRKAAEDRMS